MPTAEDTVRLAQIMSSDPKKLDRKLEEYTEKISALDKKSREIQQIHEGILATEKRATKAKDDAEKVLIEAQAEKAAARELKDAADIKASSFADREGVLTEREAKVAEAEKKVEAKARDVLLQERGILTQKKELDEKERDLNERLELIKRATR